MKSAIESNKFTKCDLSICNFANRHFRVDTLQTVEKHKENTRHNNIYADTMDSVHYYIFHLTETGMRQSIEANDDNDSEEEKQENPSSSDYFDSSFKRECDIINESRETTNRFTRISGNKFNVSVVEDEVHDDDTFLDAVYAAVLPKDNDENVVFSVKEIIEANDYDTDSLDLDFQMFITDKKSNLSQLLNDQKDAHDKIVKLLEKSKSMWSLCCFSVFID